MTYLHDFATFSFDSLKIIFTWFFGSIDSFFLALITLLILDHIVGRSCRMIQHKHIKDIANKDIVKKFMILILVGVAHIIDDILFSKPTLKIAVILFYISNQGVSILAFADELGMPVPQKLKEILAQIREKNDKNDTEEISKNSKTSKTKKEN